MPKYARVKLALQAQVLEHERTVRSQHASDETLPLIVARAREPTVSLDRRIYGIGQPTYCRIPTYERGALIKSRLADGTPGTDAYLARRYEQ